MVFDSKRNNKSEVNVSTRVDFDSGWFWSGGFWLGWILTWVDFDWVEFDSGWFWPGGFWLRRILIGLILTWVDFDRVDFDSIPSFCYLVVLTKLLYLSNFTFNLLIYIELFNSTPSVKTSLTSTASIFISEKSSLILVNCKKLIMCTKHLYAKNNFAAKRFVWVISLHLVRIIID